MLVSDRSLARDTADLLRQIAAAIAGGVNAVQVREKDLPDAELLTLSRRIVAIAAGRAFVSVNGRPRVALAAGADGVHAGEEIVPTRTLKRALRGRLLVGRSVHDLPGAVAAAHDGANYLVLGTIFPSRSHPGGETGGLARVRQVTAAVSLPVIAIGGITAENAAEVVRAGAAGVAVISAILGRPDPQAAARGLRQALDQGIIEARGQRVNMDTA
ncbi:MAG TPA: thiamine phosphate synthase [Dehalococcoidia bacterium]|nr:thiamine phosphate synthase [Dehalococcoidia bacterium]